jgi:hypothetical protein
MLEEVRSGRVIIVQTLYFREQIQFLISLINLFKKYQNLPENNRRMIAATKYKIMHFKKQITERKRKKTVNNQNCYTIQDCASLQSQVVTFLYCDISFDTR